MVNNNDKHHDTTTRMLHWVSALLFIAALLIGLYFSTLDYRNDKADYAKFVEVIHWHKTFGVLVFVLVFWRLYHRFRNPLPELPAGTPAWMNMSARISHMALYSLILVLGASGLIASDIGNYPVRLFTLWPIPQFPAENRELADEVFKVHMWFGNLSAFLVAIHLGAGLFHHYVMKDGVLVRMLTGKDTQA